MNLASLRGVSWRQTPTIDRWPPTPTVAPDDTLGPVSRAAAPIRVAIDAGPLYGSRTGVGVATAGLVDVLGRRDDVVLSPYLISGRATPEPGHRRLPIPGIVASHLWARSSWPRADRWVGDVDVVHGTNYVVPPTSRPSVVTVYDCWFLRHPERATPVVRRSGEQLRRAVARGATVIVSSHATAREATELLGTDRVRTIHLGPPAPVANPVDAVPERLGHLGRRPLILAIGTEEQRKGYPDLVAAFGELYDRGSDDVELVIAGRPGDASAAVDAAVRACSAAARERLHRVGPVDAGEKAWLMGAAAVLAYPSLDEGFGFPILEAQQARVPIVARSAGSIPEVAGTGALLVETDDAGFPIEFAASLERALADGSLRDELVRAGTANLERFCWRRTGDELFDTYTEVLSS